MDDAAKIKELQRRLKLAVAVVNNSECPYWGLGEHTTKREKQNCPYCRALMAWDDDLKVFGEIK